METDVHQKLIRFAHLPHDSQPATIFKKPIDLLYIGYIFLYINVLRRFKCYDAIFLHSINKIYHIYVVLSNCPVVFLWKNQRSAATCDFQDTSHRSHRSKPDRFRSSSGPSLPRVWPQRNKLRGPGGNVLRHSKIAVSPWKKHL